MKERELNFVNNLNNRVRKRYYCDNNNEINNILVEENDQIYSINDNELFQVEVLNTEETKSGDIVNFIGKNRTTIDELKINLNPQQDLHGYDSPWPAGGGKNKLSYPYGFTTQTSNGCTATVQSDGTMTFSGTPSANALFNIKRRTETSGDNSLFLPEGEYILNGCPSGGSGTTYQMSVSDASGTLATDRGSGATFNVPGGGTYCTIQVAIYSGTNPNSIVFKPMIRLSSVTDATFAPFANECPISGWTGAEVVGTGKNLISNKKVLWGNSIFLGTDVFGFQSEDNTHSITLPAGTYTLSLETADGTNTNIYVAEVGIHTAFARAYNNKSVTFTLSETTDCRLWVYKDGYSTVGVEAITQFQLEIGPTASTYEPYQGESLSINWQDEAGTVYGGTLAIDEDGSCKLTVDRAMVDLGTLTWTYSTSSGHERFVSNVISPSAKPAPGSTLANAICSMYKTATSNQVYAHSANCIFCIDGDGKVQVYDSGYTDATAFKTAVTGQKIVYELATPLTYQLTGQEVEALIGINNIWSNVGSIELKVSTKGLNIFKLNP